MKFTVLKKVYLFFISLGANEEISKSELKKIKLFNFFCLLWYVLAVALVFLETPSYKHFFNTANLAHIIFAVLLGAIQYIHYQKKRTLAYSLFILLLLAIVFVFSNFLIKGELLEYYYILIPPAALVFINNKKIIWSILIISLLAFMIPNRIEDQYPEQNFNNLVQPFLLIIVFMVIDYFKKINIKNERALEQKTKELEKKNEFQSQFFRNISHEIRTPLTLIKGQVDELKEDQHSKLGLQNIRKELNTQVDKIEKMVDEVLDIEKMETNLFKLYLEDVNMSEVVRKAYHSFRSSFKQKGIHYNFKKPIKNYIVLADKHQIERTLNNIIKNALKYTSNNGTVTVELKRRKDEILISIMDTGIGIPEKDINNIWNTFYQAENDINKAGGTGIGLSFCKKIIELHKGRLEVRSKENKGSVFNVILPLKETKTKLQVSQKIKSKEEEFKFPKTSEFIGYEDTRFLVVDDDWEIRNLLKKYLDSFICMESDNGVDALHVIENHQIDIVIVDYMMPKMNGFEFIQTLRKQNHSIPIIMLTARTDRESKLEVLRLGIDDYIHKPFDKEELLIRIHNVLFNYKNRVDFIKTKGIQFGELTKNNLWTQEVVKYVNQECVNPKLKLDDIANHFNVSLSTLKRKIESTTGQKPKEFVREIKLQKARSIMENRPSISLKELCIAVGYLHNHNFSKIYYNRFGDKPWNE